MFFVQRFLVFLLVLFLGFPADVWGQATTSARGATSALLTPQPLPFDKVEANTFSDELEIQVGYLNSPQAVSKSFNGKMWRKRYVPFQFTFTNHGHYPIEISTGNILLWDKDLTPKKISSQLNQLQSTPPVASKPSTKSKAAPNIPPFIPPTPPGIVFAGSKRVQYGWKSNLGLVAITGLTLGLATPLTAPAMLVGNMYRGSNKKLVTNFQDQSLGRITLDPGETATTWIFYRRAAMNQKEMPLKILVADLYCPELDKLSGLTLDFQPVALKQPAIRRVLSEAEETELALYTGKIVDKVKDEQHEQVLQDLQTATSPHPESDKASSSSMMMITEASEDISETTDE